MRRVKYVTIFGFLAAAFLLLSPASAQPPQYVTSPYIYRLKIGQCRHEPAARAQTGFRVQGVEGIVTALHGIVDCRVINAVSDNYQYIYNGLTISAVDVDRDVALLSSPELAKFVLEGLNSAAQADIDFSNLHLIGYPVELEDQLLTTQVVANYTQQLRKLVPASYRSALQQRNSPNLTTNVMRVEAHLAPGHSGAPFLTEDGDLVAVANGGLRQGTLEIGWAMPWSDIKLLPISRAGIRTRLATLANLDPHDALAFSSTYPADPEEYATEPKQTRIVKYLPPMPKAKKSGACWIESQSTNRLDAWRCAVGSLIYDPCFEVRSVIVPSAQPRVVCFGDLQDETSAFQLILTEPLPEHQDAPPDEQIPWQLELEDGTICRFITGATGILNGRRIDYFCGPEFDGFKVVHDIRRGQLYEAEIVYLDQEGYPNDFEVVPILTAWY